MRHFDHDYVLDVIRRLSAIKPDAKPAWDVLTRQGMIQHLADTVRFSMGKLGDLPDRSNWFSRKIIAPLILNGIVPIPRNLKTPDYARRSTQDDLETLHALLEEYLSLVQAGEFVPKRHPALGDLGVDGWAKLHLVHFEHHLKQFGM
jgi:hypothetical protein